MLKHELQPYCLAIVGGSGSGKSWLADRICRAFPNVCNLIRLDDFYRDLSFMTLEQRERNDFDDPSSIDWERFREAMRRHRQGLPVSLPVYDYGTHTRRAEPRRLTPLPLTIVEGLWLLRAPADRDLFDDSVYTECDVELCLKRRIERDLAERRRTPESVERQFRTQVHPQHLKHVVPQKARAARVVQSPVAEEVVWRLVEALRARLRGVQSSPLSGTSRYSPGGNSS